MPVPEQNNDAGSISTSDSKGLITVLHTERRMKVYGVTENELRTITIINLAVAALFSIGTGLVVFGFDLQKDILLTEQLPPGAKILDDVVRPASFIGGAVFYGLGLVFWFMRGGFIRTIKKETTD